MKPTLQLEGGKELEAALLELQGATAIQVVRRALEDSLVSVQDSAKGRVAHDTGKLQRSIGIGFRLTRRQKRLNQPIVSAQGVEAYVGPGVVGGKYDGRHGHLVEFGTRHMKPRAFMRPAWSANIQAVFNTLAKTMGLEIAKAAKRAAKKALKAKR